jgi:hypothetical protein
VDFQLGDNVLITNNKRQGRIISVWHDLDGPTRFGVEYTSEDGVVCFYWLMTRNLQRLSANPPGSANG